MKLLISNQANYVFRAKNDNPIKNKKEITQLKDFKEAISSLIERSEDIPEYGLFRNVVQIFPTQKQFINGYLTIMPSLEDRDERQLVACVKHTHRDYITQKTLVEGDLEKIQEHLEFLNKNPEKLKPTYEKLIQTLQKHFDTL